METTKPASSNLGSLAKTVTKILRLRRAGGGGAGSGVGITPDGDELIKEKLKLSRNLGEFPPILSDPTGDGFDKGEDKQKQQHHAQKFSSKDKEAMEYLLANLFASVSAVKASYAQLQVAQSPYDPDSIQAADQAVVSELKRLSELKQSFLKNQFHPNTSDSQPALAAQIQEQRNLVRTYQITTNKLETELKEKDAEVLALQSQLLENQKQNNALEARLHPGKTLASLDDLHLSGLNPTHFLTALRYAFKAVGSFVKLMEKEMESAGWDLDAAADAVQPGVLRRKPGHRTFAFESYVCQKMFSAFHRRDYDLRGLEERSRWDRKQFFDEFVELMSSTPKQLVEGSGRRSAVRKFLRAKYLALVHPKMEAAFFGNLEQRGVVSSGRGFPDSAFFAGYAEMARRVWLLHCLFFSFAPEDAGSIFQAPQGCRFSEVYMDSVAEDEDAAVVGRRPAVGFTVVPGFRVGRTLIQCKVYLSSSPKVDNGRS